MQSWHIRVFTCLLPSLASSWQSLTHYTNSTQRTVHEHGLGVDKQVHKTRAKMHIGSRSVEHRKHNWKLSPSIQHSVSWSKIELLKESWFIFRLVTYLESFRYHEFIAVFELLSACETIHFENKMLAWAILDKLTFRSLSPSPFLTDIPENCNSRFPQKTNHVLKHSTKTQVAP